MLAKELEAAYEPFASALRAGGFSDPDVGWSAELIGAHVALNNEVIAALTERIAAGEELEYDNREVTDEEALREYAVAAGDLAALASAVERSAERIARAWSSLDERGSTYVLPATLVDSGLVVHDGPIPMEAFLEVNASHHLQLHLDQLLALRA